MKTTGTSKIQTETSHLTFQCSSLAQHVMCTVYVRMIYGHVFQIARCLGLDPVDYEDVSMANLNDHMKQVG